MRASKISAPVFRAVLKEFARDSTIAETAARTGLSANSIAALFGKLRVFFHAVGLFTEYPAQALFGTADENPEYELELLTFHLKRIRAKRGLKIRPGQPDYHFAESHWRFQYHMMTRQRADAPVHAMMAAHLLELIRLCGPVGAPPVNRTAGLMTIARQMDQRLLWLERNAPSFKSPEDRAMLRDIWKIQPSPLPHNNQNTHKKRPHHTRDRRVF